MLGRYGHIDKGMSSNWRNRPRPIEQSVERVVATGTPGNRADGKDTVAAGLERRDKRRRNAVEATMWEVVMKTLYIMTRDGVEPLKTCRRSCGRAARRRCISYRTSSHVARGALTGTKCVRVGSQNCRCADGRLPARILPDPCASARAVRMMYSVWRRRWSRRWRDA
jgi:hypothetical protein